MTNQLTQYSIPDHALKWLLPGLIVLAGFAISLILAGYEQEKAFEIQRDLARESLNRLSSNLEQALYERLTVTTALGAFVQAHGSTPLELPQQQHKFKEHFKQFTSFLGNRTPGIISMQLAPQGVVTYITNEERNRKALGHDLLIDDARRTQVIETINKHSMIAAGPLKLIQGGEAIIARQALFTVSGAFPPERYNRLRQTLPETFDVRQIPDDFWGLATVLIDTQALFQAADLQEITKGYTLAIRGKHGLGEQGEVFWGSPSVFDQPTLTVPVMFPGGSWVIGLKLELVPLGSNTLLLPFICVLGFFALAYAVASRDSRNQALAHSRAKNTFLSTMSHELRTPMNAIIGFAQILDYDDKLDQDQHENVKEILTAGDHLLTLINEVLDLAKIESGAIELAIEPVNLKDLCEECRQLIAPLASQRNISVQVSMPGGLAAAADRLRLKQVLLNLLSNALKYNQEGGTVKIAASLRRKHVRILVEDNGRGISKADQARLFEPFSRVNEGAGDIQGTGVGLTIVKGLVSLMEGRLGMESAPGVGSRFWVDLEPATPGHENTDCSGANSGQPRSRSKPDPNSPGDVNNLSGKGENHEQ